MSGELLIESKTYVPSKNAADSTGYAQDYIGQLARGGFIDARRIGGLWYVSVPSLEGYKKNAEKFKPEPPTRQDAQEPSALVFFDGKEYFSASRAAQATGYTQDYVGQLARSGTVLSRQVGNRWYVEKATILEHKRQKDALLASVQAEAVGLPRQKDALYGQSIGAARKSAEAPLLNYFNESADLLPLSGKTQAAPAPALDIGPWKEEIPEHGTQNIPIRRVRYEAPQSAAKPQIVALKNEIVVPQAIRRVPSIALLAGTAFTIVIVLSVGYVSVLKQNATYASRIPTPSNLAASAEAVMSDIGNALEPILSRELIYERSGSQ